jgi:hypothetical protein
MMKLFNNREIWLFILLKKKKIFNKLNCSIDFNKSTGVMFFEEKEIRIKELDFFRTKEIIYMSNIEIGEVNKIKATQKVEEYDIVFNENIQQKNIFLSLVSYCYIYNFSFN